MRKWLKFIGIFNPKQYKEPGEMLILSERHTDMHIELFDSRDNIIAALHKETHTITIEEE